MKFRNLEVAEVKISNLGEIASKLKAVSDYYREACDVATEDLKAFNAPSECYGDVLNSIERQENEDRQAVLDYFGISYEEYRKEVNSRIKVSY